MQFLEMENEKMKCSFMTYFTYIKPEKLKTTGRLFLIIENYVNIILF